MDNEVIRIALGLCLGLPIYDPHPCSQCNQEIGRLGTHGLSCHFWKGRHSRHAAVNDIIKRSLASLKISSHLEPSGLYRSDGKWPDGATIVPWKQGRILVWDATCPDTLAPSHQVVANDAENKNLYQVLPSGINPHLCACGMQLRPYIGAFGRDAKAFIQDLGQLLIIPPLQTPCPGHF